MIDEQSEKVLAQLYPPFAEKLRQLIGVLGENWRVDEGFRRFAEQDVYFEQGRSRPGALVTRDRAGYSGHNYGTAAHVRPTVDGKVVQGYNAEFFKLAAEADNLGLEWGGSRDGSGKFIEMSRVEMVILSMDECLSVFKKGGLPAVWAAFDAELGVVKLEPAVETVETDAEEAIETEETKEESNEKGSPVVARRKKAAPKKPPSKKQATKKR